MYASSFHTPKVKRLKIAVPRPLSDNIREKEKILHDMRSRLGTLIEVFHRNEHWNNFFPSPSYIGLASTSAPVEWQETNQDEEIANDVPSCSFIKVKPIEALLEKNRTVNIETGQISSNIPCSKVQQVKVASTLNVESGIQQVAAPDGSVRASSFLQPEEVAMSEFDRC